MESYLALPKGLLWLLMAMQAGVPLPWIHRHCDLRTDDILSHLNACHRSSQSLAASDWHVHFLYQNFSISEEGLNNFPPLRNRQLAEIKQSVFLDDNRKIYLDCVKFLGQPAIQFYGHLPGLASDGELSYVETFSLEEFTESLDRCLNLCVRQI